MGAEMDKGAIWHNMYVGVLCTIYVCTTYVCVCVLVWCVGTVYTHDPKCLKNTIEGVQEKTQYHSSGALYTL